MKLAKQPADAALDAAGAQYRTVMLSALQNVADSLYALQFDARAARNSLEAAHASLNQRSITYLDLLNAQAAQAQAISNLEQAPASHLADTAALFVALGGRVVEPARSGTVVAATLESAKTVRKASHR